MTAIQNLLTEVGTARESFIKSASGLNADQAKFKPTPESWCITEVAEHMFWAEFGGINGMWRTLDAFKANQPIFIGERIHHGLSIEEIVQKTWKEKETVPEVAKPHVGGVLKYWLEALHNLQNLLAALTKELEGQDLEMIIHPHPISGPLNIIQRYHFLRFHLNRHQNQIERIKAHPNFPIITKLKV